MTKFIHVIGIGCLCIYPGYLQRVQIFLRPFICEIFTYKKHPIHRNSLAMVINMHFLCQYIVKDIKQTCLGQGLGVKITARKRTSKVKNLGHTSDLYIYRSLVIRCLVVKIEYLQVTVDVVTLKNPCKPQR